MSYQAIPLDPSHQPRGVPNPLALLPILRGLGAVTASSVNPIMGLPLSLKPGYVILGWFATQVRVTVQAENTCNRND